MKTRQKRPRLEWYGAKAIFQHREKRGFLYEERIILLRAKSFDDAIRLAEIEAKRYARGLSDCKYTDFVDVFHIFEDVRIGHQAEVYSLMRESRLEPKTYLDRFYDTGRERTGSA